MPLVQVNVLPGYSDDIKQQLCSELTWTIQGVTGAAADGISVWLHEVPAQHYQRGGQMRTPAAAPTQTAKALVVDYLAAMEARDLDKARHYLAENFQMCFPGGARFTDLNALVDWSKTRYRFVNKTIDSTQTSYDADTTVVFCHGTLAGEWPDGEGFKGVRFIDRFELEQGRLVRQDVWNDLALSQPRFMSDD